MVPVGAVIAIGALAYVGLVLLQNATDRTVELNTEIGTTTRSISQTEEAIETLSSQIEQTETAIQPLEGIASVFDNTFMVINAERDDMNGDVSPVVSLAKGDNKFSKNPIYKCVSHISI